LIFDQRNLG